MRLMINLSSRVRWKVKQPQAAAFFPPSNFAIITVLPKRRTGRWTRHRPPSAQTLRLVFGTTIRTALAGQLCPHALRRAPPDTRRCGKETDASSLVPSYRPCRNATDNWLLSQRPDSSFFSSHPSALIYEGWGADKQRMTVCLYL